MELSLAMEKQQKMYVSGEITIPICFPVSLPTKEESLKFVASLLNGDTISVIKGDIHTWNRSTYPIIAKDVQVHWRDVMTGNEI